MISAIKSIFSTTFFACALVSCMLLLGGCPGNGSGKVSDGFATDADKTTSSLLINSDLQQTQSEKMAASIRLIDSNIKGAKEDLQALSSSVQDSDNKQSIQETQNRLTNIQSEIPSITNALNVFDLTIKENVKIGKNVKGYEKRIKDLENEKANLENSAIKKLYDNIHYIFGFGLLIIIGGVAMFIWMDRKTGAIIIGLGLITLACAAGAIYYLKVVAQIGIMIILGGCALAVATALRTISKVAKEKEQTKNSLTENVKLVEDLKSKLPEPIHNEFFGDSPVAKARTIQSPATQAIVNQIRSESGLTSPSSSN